MWINSKIDNSCVSSVFLFLERKKWMFLENNNEIFCACNLTFSIKFLNAVVWTIERKKRYCGWKYCSSFAWDENRHLEMPASIKRDLSKGRYETQTAIDIWEFFSLFRSEISKETKIIERINTAFMWSVNDKSKRVITIFPPFFHVGRLNVKVNCFAFAVYVRFCSLFLS